MYAGGERQWGSRRVGLAGGGADAAAAPTGAVGRQKQAQSNPSSSGSAASTSSSRGEAAEEGGDKNKQGRRGSKRREDVVRAIRDRLPAAPSCWGNVSVVRERRGSRETPGHVGRGGGGNAVELEEEGDGSGAGSAALPAWCCLCPEGDCSLEANPSANGKEDPGLRSLLEHNDFYSDDCNPHAATNDGDDDVANASPAADFD
ncbi:unnamed protein product [Alopecurus aequalis]